MAQRVDTVVVGAGPAGLSTSHCLAQAGVDHVLLEREEQVATPWRHHYDRLHLHTTKGLSTLPDHEWAHSIGRYPSRLDVVEYLESYAQRLPRPPRFGQHVRRIERRGDEWHTQTDDAELVSTNVVIATGLARVPNTPMWPGQDAYVGDLLHSSDYRNGDAWKGKRVLVVGFGNSACEIAIDLHERGAEPSMSVRGGVNIVPRDVLGISILGIGIALGVLPAAVADFLARPLLFATVGSLHRLGLEPLPYGPNVQIREHGRIPLLDIGTVALLRNGAIQVRPEITHFTESGVTFGDGRHEDYAAIILATGYRPAVSDFLVDAKSLCSTEGVSMRSGVGHPSAGLYFCGFHVSPTGMLREMARESRGIATAIAADARRTRASNNDT